MTCPRCPACHQPLPLLPALCVCGDPENAHHLTDGGRRTYCCTGSQAGNCGCQEYRMETAAHYGPYTVEDAG